MSFRRLTLPLLCAVALQAQPAAPLEIRGTVVEGSVGIPGAEIALVEFSTVNGKEVRTVLATTFTGAKGEFTIHPARPGDFAIQVRKEGYSGANPEWDSPDGTEVSASVRENVQRTFIVNMIRPGGLSGQVVGEDGRPIANLPVAVLRQNPAARTEAVTDRDGVFTATKLAPGNYTLRIGPQSRDVIAEPLVSEAEADGVDRDLETSSSPARVNPGVTSALGTLQVRTRAYYRARVAVRSAECPPGKTWLFSIPNGGSPFDMRPFGPARFKIPCGSSFLVRNLQPGDHWFALWEDGAGRWALERVHISDKNTAVELTMLPAGHVGGRITIAQGAARTAVEGVRVDLQPEVTGLAMAHKVVATDAQGQFSFSGLPWPKYRVVVNMVPRGYYVKEVRNSGQPVPDRLVAPLQGASMTLEIVLDDKLAVLTGVAMRDGKPVSGAIVSLLPESGVPSAILGLSLGAVPASSDGRFQFPGIPPGKYRVFANVPGPAGEPAAAALDKGVTVDLAPGASQNITVEAR